MAKPPIIEALPQRLMVWLQHAVFRT